MADEIILSEKNGILSLHLNNDIIQSSMSLMEPNQLVLDYSRAMISCLLFLERYRTILHLGLGGGSLIRWFDQYFPESQQSTVEINPKIVSIAKTMFKLNELKNSVNIIIDDAFTWLYEQDDNQFDIIFVDIFNGDGILPKSVSSEFFTSSFNKLSQQGVVVFNWWQNCAHYSRNLQDLQQIFNQQVIECPATTHGNTAVMAFKEQLQHLSIKKLNQKAKYLTQQTNIDFFELLQLIKKMNPNWF